MNGYVYGNEYLAEDKGPLAVARELEGTIAGISFVFVRADEDIPFVDERYVVVLKPPRILHALVSVEPHSPATRMKWPLR